ncbi:uncharacterized protein LOC118185808 isoform X1 [Stegodyphus dumicola]|uniref:uncharacterized protein LOC118185808 isoform X1 n=1 Tax=Stegodyphus dumicola TaxID=202533 RepID=UPI0015B263B2|nr:uncharacterized protein LOC118185808 isoform X1 [Stegodyphus dumicola]XP_035211625.1 uncharacterized protein LOC118185808 isoform X1 [Stegodyphus dumicola]
MQEDTEDQNDSDSVDSEVAMFSQSPNLEFSLTNQDRFAKAARQEYEANLDQKLQELGLYEEGMTIHQKEELLAVVVVSCETAEQEETKRQILHELLEDPGDICRNDMEFSFQESAWLVNEGSLLHPTSIVCPETSLSSNISSVYSCSADFDAALEEKHFNDLLNYNSVDKFLESSPPEILECLSVSKNTSDLQQPSTSSIQRNDRMSMRSIGSFTNPANEDQSCMRTGEIIDKKIMCKEEKIQLEESMSFWKPCLSPEEKCLSSSRFELRENQEDSKFSCKPDCGKKHLAYLEDFANALIKRKRKSKIVPLSKPYLLSHRGLQPKKVNKLDSYDHMVGVHDETNIDELLQELNYIQKNSSQNESVSRISGSAFKCVRPGPSRKINCSALALENDTDGNIEFRTTRSGARYSYKKPPDKSIFTKKQITSTEISKKKASQLSLLSKNEIENLISLQDFFQDSQNNSDIICEKLPEFNNLRPDVLKPVSTIHPKASTGNQRLQNCLPDSTSEQSSANVDASHSSEHEQHLVSSSLIESDSSDNSVIDVETIVDDEIQKFVLKRKMLQNHQIGNKPKNSSYSKRMKKNGV